MRLFIVVCSLLTAHTAFAHSDHDPRGRSCASYVHQVRDSDQYLPAEMIQGMTTLSGSRAVLSEFAPFHRLILDQDSDAISAYFTALRPKR